MVAKKIKSSERRIVNLNSFVNKKRDKEIKSNEEIEIEEKIKPKNALSELYYLFNILECNNNTNHRMITNRYTATIENEPTNLEYKEVMNYHCSASKCIKCKREKSFTYLKDRLLAPNSYDTVYFITVSSPYTQENITEYTEATRELRQNIRNIFSYLKLPFFSSLEKGEEGNKLHIHLIVFLKKDTESFKTGIYISDMIRATTGYYTYLEIVKAGKKDLLVEYISKLVGYSTKFKKDSTKVNDDNFIEIDNNNFYFLKNISLEYCRKAIKNIKINDKEVIDSFTTNFESSKITSAFNNFMMFYIKNNLEEENFNDDKFNFYTLLSISFFSQQSVFEKGIRTILNNAYKKLKKHSSAYKLGEIYHIEKTLFNQEIQNKLLVFSKRFLTGVFNKFYYYLKILKKIKTKKTIYKENKIYNPIFFTSDIKKRILSNISIYDTRIDRYIGNLKINFKDNKQRLVLKGFDMKKIKHKYNYITIVEHDLNMKYRSYRIETEIDKAIYKNNMTKTNLNKNNNLSFKSILNDSIARMSLRKYNKYKHRVSNKDKYISSNIKKMLSHIN